jgi:hypothetical protein
MERAGDVLDGAQYLPLDIGSLDDLGVVLAVIVGIVVVAVVVIPLLLFGLELIVAGVIIAAGILARSLLGRPWLVQATPRDGAEGARAWEVRGLRRSGRLVDEVAAQLAAGREPSPAHGGEVLTAGATTGL